MTTKQYLSKAGEFSTHLALASFGIGTLILVAHKLLPGVQHLTIIIGFLYVLLAFLVNGIVFLYLIYCFIIDAAHREYFMIKMLIMGANIPIIICYITFIINLNF